MTILGVRISYSKWPKIAIYSVLLHTFHVVYSLRTRGMNTKKYFWDHNLELTSIDFFVSRYFFMDFAWCNVMRTHKIKNIQWKSMKINENQWKSMRNCWFLLIFDDVQGARSSTGATKDRASDTRCPNTCPSTPPQCGLRLLGQLGIDNLSIID